MRKRRLVLLIGGVWHPFERCGEMVKGLLESTGRYEVVVTADRDVLRRGAVRRFDGVLAYTSGGTLSKEQEEGLVGFVKSGGTFVGIHCAAASWQKNKAYVDMLGGTFATHSPLMEFPVTITGVSSLITKRIQSFRIVDELYLLDKFNPDTVEILATAMWKGKPQPIAYTKSYGKGNVFYLALGHDEAALGHPEFQKMLVRGVDWSFGRTERKPLKAGVVGYGRSFKMGKLHLESLRDAAGFEPVAICDLVEQRRKEGVEDFPVSGPTHRWAKCWTSRARNSWS